MKIDAHQHFWKYSPATHGWITDRMKVLKQDFMPARLLPELAGAGYAGCVAVQAAQTEAENDFLLSLASRHSFVKGVVGWLDLQGAQLAKRLRHYARHPLFCGLRHIVQDEPDECFLLRPRFLEGIARLQDYGLTYDVLVYPKQLPAVLEFVARFPGQPFVLDHLGKPSIKDGKGTEAWEGHIAELGKFPNVYCKLSGMATEADWHQWTPEVFAPYYKTVLEAFGPNRLMAGSDWPVCLLAGSYGKTAAAIGELLGSLPEPEKTAVLGGNATAFYRLKV